MTPSARGVTFRVHGRVAPQGSKNVYRGRVVEASRHVAAWRDAVAAEALQVFGTAEPWWPRTTPLEVSVTFLIARPKAHYRSDGFQLRPTAPRYVASTPDLDKCVRATLDALQACGVLADDAQVAALAAAKQYSPHPGAQLTLRPVRDEEPDVWHG